MEGHVINGPVQNQCSGRSAVFVHCYKCAFQSMFLNEIYLFIEFSCKHLPFQDFIAGNIQFLTHFGRVKLFATTRAESHFP